MPSLKTPPPTQPPTERVNHPPHYGGDTTYETIKVLEAWLTAEEFIGFLKGNVIKYNSRARLKNGHEDSLKAHWYQTRLVKFEADLARKLAMEHDNED